jgi:hypothetical protein
LRAVQFESLTETPSSKTILRLAGLPWEHLAPLLFFAVMYLYYPYRNIFEADTDEGINLMKALLVERGFPLYQAIWSDQPPLFTHLLGWSFRQFGLEVNVGRTLVLVFASLLVWGLVIAVRRVWGGWHALAALLLVVLLPFFPQLSTQVLISLPAISLAVLSLAAMILWHQNNNPLVLLCSAVFLSLSVLIKLFTGLLAPIFMAGLFLEGLYIARQNPSAKKPWLPLQFWTTVFVVLLIVFSLWLVGPENLRQLLLPHLASQNLQVFEANIPSFSIESYLSDSWPLLILALVGVLTAIWRRRWLALYPLAWLLVAYLLLKWNTPVWYDHQLLVTIPAVMLAAGAAGEVISLPLEFLHNHRLSWIGLGLWLPALILTSITLAHRLPVVVPEFTSTPYYNLQAELEPPKELRIVREINRYAPETQWMVTDMPIYAFRAGLPVPPELAVFSIKRVASGDLSEAYILEIIDRYDPELILWGRFDLRELRVELASRYRQEYAFRGKVLYLRVP